MGGGGKDSEAEIVSVSEEGARRAAKAEKHRADGGLASGGFEGGLAGV